MRYAVIKNGEVKNVILADQEFIDEMSRNDSSLSGVQLAEDSPVSIGYLYNGTDFAAPVPVVVDNPTTWLIDVGPFMDRFGAAKMAVLTSTDTTVRAILQDMFARKWLDLKRADVGTAIDAIRAAVPAVTAAMKTAILTTPVQPEENLALRRLYFA